MCKHVHLALLIAASRNIDIEMERSYQVNEVLESEQYFHDKTNKQIEIFSVSCSVSFVNLETYSCSCFAYSHGINCVCSKVAKRVVPPPHNLSDLNDTVLQKLNVPSAQGLTTEESIKRYTH